MILRLFLLIAITLISYINIIGNEFAYDDDSFILNWQETRDIANIPSLFAGDLPAGHQGVYRPIRSLIYTLSYKLYGQNPAMYHAQAIILQILNTLLVFLIIQIIFKNQNFAFLTAALFGTHPIHTEAITFTSASFDSIGILFFLLAFYTYVVAFEQKRKIIYLSSIIYAYLAYLTYEATLTLPLLILLYDFFVKDLNFKDLLKRFKIYLLYFGSFLSYIVVRFFILGVGTRASYLGMGFWEAAKSARTLLPDIYLKYAFDLFFPINLTNTPQVHTHFYKTLANTFNLNFLNSYSDILVPLITFFTLFIIYLGFIKRSVFGFFYWWFFITLLPVSSILPQGAAYAERYLYIPSLSFCILISLILYKIYQNSRSKILPRLIIFALIASYLLLTIQRNMEWRSSFTLWDSAVKVNPKDSKNHSALAFAYSIRGNHQEAVKELKIALSQNPLDTQTLTSLGLVYQKLNKIELAIEAFESVLNKQNPSLDDYYNAARSSYSLGYIYHTQGKEKQAEQQYKKAEDIYKQLILQNPKFIAPYINLGAIYENRGDLDLAENQFRQVLKLTPNNALAFYNLGVVYEKRGQEITAEEFFQKAITSDNDLAVAHNSLGIIYGKRNQIDRAIDEFKKVLELDKKNAYAYFNLGLIYEGLGKKDLAISQYKMGLQILPEKNIEERVKNLSQ